MGEKEKREKTIFFIFLLLRIFFYSYRSIYSKNKNLKILT